MQAKLVGFLDINIENILLVEGITHSRNAMLDRNGVDCELLRLGAQQWKQGKLRINFNVSLEFVPDEAENEITPQITVPESNIKYQYQNRNKSAA